VGDGAGWATREKSHDGTPAVESEASECSEAIYVYMFVCLFVAMFWGRGFVEVALRPGFDVMPNAGLPTSDIFFLAAQLQLGHCVCAR